MAECPRVSVPAKRSFATVPVGFDWHDYLALTWEPGRQFVSGEAIRLMRSRSRGFQFRVSQAGVSGMREPVWPLANGGMVRDGGTLIWIAEAVTTDSLRTSIVDSQWPTVDGITLSSPRNSDLRYMIDVAGGADGQKYQIKQQVVFASGEQDEGIADILVCD